MATVKLQREWYRPRRPVILYVSRQRVLIRARPAKVRNPRTSAQQANRGKMAIASRFLSHLQDFVAHGFASGKRPNGRPVGAYHVALGHLLNNAMSRKNGQWRIDYAQVQLSEGQTLKAFPMRVKRDGRTLRLAWEKGLPEGTRRIRLAFHSAKKHATQCLEVNAPKRGEAIEVLLPKWAKSGALHMWWHPIEEGKTRWRSRYLFIPADATVITGCMVYLSGNTSKPGGASRVSGRASCLGPHGDSAGNAESLPPGSRQPSP